MIIGIIDEDQIRPLAENAPDRMEALARVSFEPPARDIFKSGFAFRAAGCVIRIDPQCAARRTVPGEVPHDQKMFLNVFQLEFLINSQIFP